MNVLFDSIPGIEMPIPKISQWISTRWYRAHAINSGAPSDIRPSQMNLVLHFGTQTSIQDARNIFQQAIHFAKTHPCRIIALCPQSTLSQDHSMQGKIFCQCYLKRDDLDENCFCEALVLGYSTEKIDYLESQLSLWLESDLPTYYWLNRVSSGDIQKHYLNFAGNCQKLIFDSSIEPEDFHAIPWRNPKLLKDLVADRLLPLRQSIGQFFSLYSPSTLTQDLTEIIVSHPSQLKAEAHSLLNWNQLCLAQCSPRDSSLSQYKFSTKTLHADNPCLQLKWFYNNPNKFFNWQYSYKSQVAQIHAKLENNKSVYDLSLPLLEPTEVLASALFN